MSKGEIFRKYDGRQNGSKLGRVLYAERKITAKWRTMLYHE